MESQSFDQPPSQKPTPQTGEYNLHIEKFSRKDQSSSPVSPVFRIVAPHLSSGEQDHSLKVREQEIAEFTGLTPIISRILASRGFMPSDELKNFLQPNLASLPDKWSIVGMKKAVGILAESVIERKKIALCCDYDIDGTTSASILYRALRELGARVEIFPSRRFSDGYGINEQRVREIATQGFDTLVTLDFGTKNHKELKLAKVLGLKSVVVDHHHKPEGPKLPADALINPKQDGCGYQGEDLCTAGLAWITACALKERLEKSRGAESRDARVRARQLDTDQLIAYAAIGTIGDVVELRGANRAIVKDGLLQLSVTTHKGLRAIKEECNLRAEVYSEDVAFQIGPRNNAVGRLINDGAKLATNLYTTDVLREARELAPLLTQKNEERKTVERETFRSVEAEIKKMRTLPSAIVVAKEGLHEGVIGIVASRIVERYNRPAFIFTKAEDGNWKGSGRGMDVAALHLAEALEVPGVKDCLVRVGDQVKAGGHRRAAGATVQAEKMSEFALEFTKAIANQLEGKDISPLERWDVEVTLAEINSAGPRLIDELKILEPTGEKNPAAKLCLRGATVVTTQLIKGQHLKVLLRQDYAEGSNGEQTHSEFGYAMLWHAKEHPVIKPGAVVDIVGKPKLDTRHADYNPAEQRVRLDILAASSSR